MEEPMPRTNATQFILSLLGALSASALFMGMATFPYV